MSAFVQNHWAWPLQLVWEEGWHGDQSTNIDSNFTYIYTYRIDLNFILIPPAQYT